MMKQFTFLASVVLFACNNNPSEGDLKKIEWLVGHWDRTNVKEGRTAHEKWESVSDQELRGWGVSLKGVDTSFVEKLRIVTKDGAIYYVADVAENPEPIYFLFTSISNSGFVCENPDHDFPKKIQYELLGDTLKATTSGDNDQVLGFSFVKR